jgi:hypothetical protein
MSSWLDRLVYLSYFLFLLFFSSFMIVSLVLSITFILYIYWENFILYIITSRDSPVLPSLYSVQIKYKKL